MKGLIPIGTYIQRFNELLNLSLPCETIYKSKGVETHIRKRHPYCVPFIEKIPEIISNPDFIGNNPKEPDSIEFVKQYDENILLAVKLDARNNYLYVASLFEISEYKLKSRVNSGRLKPFDKSY